MTAKVIFGIAAAALLFAGCASTAESGPDNAETEGDRTVVVENHGWETVRVFAVRNSTKMRLGMVQGMNTQRFTLKPGMITPQGYLRLLLSPIAGGRDHLTDPVAIRDGGVIHLDVRDMVQTSSFSVFSQDP